MKMYKTGGWRELIEVVEVTKVTEKSVWFANGRYDKKKAAITVAIGIQWKKLKNTLKQSITI
jgi:hypothetical protein